MVATLLVVCLVSGLALAGVHATTAPIVAEQEAKALQEGLAKVLPGSAQFEPIPVPEGFPQVKGVWKSDKGWVVEAAPSGYGGAIRMLLGVTPEGTVTRLEILNAAGETPGLGSKITERPWLSQFDGAKLTVPLVKGKQPAGGEVQAITGATISSRAVVDGVNQALEAVKRLQNGR